MPDFDFCGDAYTARSIYQNAQELINWYPEVDQRKKPGDRGYITLYPTPGMGTFAELATGEIRGLWVLPGGRQMITVSGDKVYLVQLNGAHAQIGTLLGSSGPVWIRDNGQSAYIVDGGNRYTYNIGTGAFATVSVLDGPFTGGGTLDELDNVFIYNQPGTRNWAASDVASTVTNSLSLGQKFSSSDNIVALIADHRQVYLLGESTSEIDINAGTSPFTFQIIPGATIQHGCAAAASVARLGESFAFLAQDTRGTGVVVQANGSSFSRISTYGIEIELVGQVLSDARAFTYQIDGHEFYVLILPTANKSFAYDSSTGMWHKWLDRDGFGNFKRIRANCGVNFGGRPIVGDYQNGKLYYLSFDLYTNDGDLVKRQRVCPHLTNGLKRVFYHDLQIQFQPGVGTASNNPQAIIEWSNDGGSTYGQQYSRGIGKVGQYLNRCRVTPLGQGRDRVFRVSVVEDAKIVVVSAELNYTVSSS